MAFQSIQQMLEQAEAKNLPLWETILEDDVASQNRTREESLNQMRYFWEAHEILRRTLQPDIPFQ